MLTQAQMDVLRKKLEGFKKDCDFNFPEGSKSPATINDVSQLAIYVHGLLGDMLKYIEEL